MSEKHTAPKKILVADDSLTIQKVIRLALSGDGYEIQTVSDGKEAIEQASLFRPDICIIDVSLPIFDAYQIREQLMNKPDLKNIPVILMSSAFEKVDETLAQSLGFSGHLIKPFDPSHLRSILLSVANAAPSNDPVIETINSSYITSGAGSERHKSMQPIHLTPPNFSDVGSQDFPPLQMDNAAAPGPMDDIQQMAKNTFEMSGINQHDWGMIELGKMNEPEPFSTSEVSAMDFPSTMPEMNHAQGYSNEGAPQFSVTAQELETMIQTQVTRALEQMHTQLRERIEHELRAEVHAQIPNLAEKIIKEEIRKLLSEPPV
jgi:CheY-like chemotaxis protein